MLPFGRLIYHRSFFSIIIDVEPGFLQNDSMRPFAVFMKGVKVFLTLSVLPFKSGLRKAGTQTSVLRAPFYREGAHLESAACAVRGLRTGSRRTGSGARLIPHSTEGLYQI